MSSRRYFVAYTFPTLAALGAARLLLPTRSNADDATGIDTATARASGGTLWAPVVIQQPTATPTATPTAAPTATPTASQSATPIDVSQPTPTPIVVPPASEGALLGPASGLADQAVVWLVQRAVGYNEADIRSIVSAYQRIGEAGGVDWFLMIAQMCLETGSLTSWWSQRPRRNPAGIGVTGRSVAGLPDAPPNNDPFRWAFRDGQWYEGVSFAQWDTDAIAAHIGRILAYALAAPHNDNQRQLIDWALYVRPLSANLRGSAQTIIDLNGRWAVPGTTYGQSILMLRDRMRA